ncbi:hypothetical protein D3C74_20110 [compost metagenome]
MNHEARPTVRCSVSNCNYWGQDNVCNAEAILINIDEYAKSRLKEEYASESFGTEQEGHAETSAATCCHTFKPKK